MRILWVKVGGLWPPDTGGRLRSYHIVSELARRHEVVLLTTHGADADPDGLAAHLPEGTRLLSVPYAIPKRGTARFALALGRCLLSPLPVDLAKFCVPALSREVRRLLSVEEVDLCVADFLSSTPNVPLGGGIPVVLFAHNIEHLIWKRLSGVERRPWRRAVLELEWRKMRRYEARVCGRASLTIAVSDADRERLVAEVPGARIRSVPTGVDCAFFAPNGAVETPDSLVFTGSMDWFPNEDAVLHFIGAVLPRIRAEVPGASVTVVGRNPTPRLRAAAAASDVRVTGKVEDVRPYVREAAVYVVPLRVGGGTRLKIFEALAMGKAVVSTAVGAEGLPLVSGEHFVRADDPDQFAGAVVSLLRDPARRGALGRAGRDLVETRYSWAQVGRQFEARCEEALSCHAS